MDVRGIIAELRSERQQIERAILSLKRFDRRDVGATRATAQSVTEIGSIIETDDGPLRRPLTWNGRERGNATFPTERGKTVLLAEDEQPVRPFVLAMPLHQGYSVIVAVDGCGFPAGRLKVLEPLRKQPPEGCELGRSRRPQ